VVKQDSIGVEWDSSLEIQIPATNYMGVENEQTGIAVRNPAPNSLNLTPEHTYIAAQIGISGASIQFQHADTRREEVQNYGWAGAYRHPVGGGGRRDGSLGVHGCDGAAAAVGSSITSSTARGCGGAEWHYTAGLAGGVSVHHIL
jgi:hypothetical protein